jgi:pilus assembly protein CpaE
MSEQQIKILIVDDNQKSRDKLIEQLRFEDVSVVGESSFGAAAYTWAQQLDVDVIIVMIDEPIARSLRTIESLSVGANAWPILGMSPQTDRETMRKAIVAGVRDFLVWPATDEELHQAILTVHRTEQTRRAAVTEGRTAGQVGTIVAVVGVKGGIGKSTVASNTAVALAEETKQQIAMVDLDLQFGDAAVMLDLVPTRTIEQAASELTGSDPQLIRGYLADHGSRVKLLAAPTTPEGAETITEQNTQQILESLAATHDYVVVDTSAQLDDISMRAMDMATIVLLVVVPEVPCVRRTRAALALMREWGYSRDKVKLVVNRTKKKGEVSIAEIEKVLDYPVYMQIPDDQAAVKGISMGTPVILSAPKSEAGRAFTDLGRSLAGLPKADRKRGLFRRKGKGTSTPRSAGPALIDPPPIPPAPVPVAVQADTPTSRQIPDGEGEGKGDTLGLIRLSPAERTNGAATFHADESVVELPVGPARRDEAGGGRS